MSDVKHETNKFNGRAVTKYRCFACGEWNIDDETVWINPENGEATTGEKGKPYCVDCAPALEEEE
jgi:hypothetical protein